MASLPEKKVLFVLEDGRMAGPQSYLVELCSKIKKFKPVVIIPKLENQEFKRRLIVENIVFREININRAHLSFLGIIKYGLTLILDVYKLIILFKTIDSSLLHRFQRN